MEQNVYERERSERFVFIFVGALDFEFCFPESNPISVSICRALLGIMTGTAQLEVKLYKPVAAKFIRFYPVLFNTNKALRVEVYGSLRGRHFFSLYQSTMFRIIEDRRTRNPAVQGLLLTLNTRISA